MNVTTGQALDGTAHLAQSIADILGTPLGWRVMRRDYGSLLFDLIDQPINAATVMLLRAATAVSLRRWEPRLKLSKVSLSGTPADGTLTITLSGTRTDVPAPNARTTLSIPLPAILASS
ncbi:GPW/gp25 family protein [Novosphingobium sp. CF614]|uniref:GPW/gp25 family protein n=1 Tax=Novosphingobium sp. CF614 TaxID=1884364 RepID=UPI0021012E0A|nr:GPW/gp25 family protein [Novosphingobium sp. CF614]